jgi:hypothetical protein
MAPGGCSVEHDKGKPTGETELELELELESESESESVEASATDEAHK